MEDITLIEKLLDFGLTRQEATIYRCLLLNQSLTGYEVSKLTGISRSNVYNALAGLVEKGAAYFIEGTANKYVAVAIDEFCLNKIKYLEAAKEYLIANMPKESQMSEGYITIVGYRHIMDKILNMIEKTQQRLYISISSQFIGEVEACLLEQVQKGIKVVLLIDDEFAKINEWVEKGVTIHITKEEKTQFRMITDSMLVLTGELTNSLNDTCLYSGQKNFVSVFKDALRNEIKLIEITKGEK